MEQKDPQTYAIIGAAMEVHRSLGHGFLETVYQEAMAIEMSLRSIPNRREVGLEIQYKGNPLKTSYRADFICYDRVIVELKAVSAMGSIEDAQLLNYLHATGMPVGLLLNFGARSLEQKRMVGSANMRFEESVESVKSVV